MPHRDCSAAVLAIGCLLATVAGCDGSQPLPPTPDHRADRAILLDGRLPDGPDGAVPDQRPPDAAVPDSPPAHRVLKGCVQGTFQPYFANLHAHTANSDGEKTPQEAFQYARDVGRLDILVVTDHLEQLYLPTNRYGACNAAAVAETKASLFVAACGFEYGTGFTPLFSSTGHNNVFDSPSLLPAVQLNFRDFYQSLVTCPTCIGQFNHPGEGPDQNWSQFEYHADADDRLQLFEFNAGAAWDLFFKALDAGWHVSPTYNQDNHGADWGTKNSNRSGLYMAQLDQPSLYSAMRQRRTFATSDKNAVIKVLADDICWMGSVLTGATSMPIAVEAKDPDATDTFGALRLLGKGGKELARFECQGANPCSAVFSVQTSQSPYFVARVDQTDGDMLVAAPVWLAP
jgi:hypothetical protein